ncbi:MAG TPA: sigma 54-interacting transcriptional regulator, partial [Candidatus Kapabacteria bacterium]|nr:sigma 54-interacting transcriptional regulator [Candidatus Kapabacteria bacterium]
MNYLLYYIDGFIKKFPLDKPTITIGRNNDNDLVIREDFISRNHVRITSAEDAINIKDLGSTNGINVQDEKVKEALIKIGESFILGKMEFILKKGSLDEFKLTKELIPIFDTIGCSNAKKSDNARTRYIQDIYNETLKIVMQLGLKKNNFNEFMLDLGNYLSNLADFGSLFIISKQEETFHILLSVKNKTIDMTRLEKIVAANPGVFTEKIASLPIEGKDASLYSSPLNIGNKNTALIFILDAELKKKKPMLNSFFSSLVMEIELMFQVLPGEPRPGEKNDREEPGRLSPGDDDIVAESIYMKELIKQSKKIAGGDIFVLIQGESGTGKELFARLIHKYSGRDKEKFIAINCAAIPENLLESELFGHEKGAFTDAYAQKKGKLEIASGGTLVLDEIGDMPVNLQSKMLRALQEKEFYRVGGAVPITVDLRIISITNKNLKQLIIENKFREDLYYRLVHRTITIPPLRERKEDISALINFFTYKFCQQGQKKINGYSIKAFDALQNYHWQGNVRQL